MPRNLPDQTLDEQGIVTELNTLGRELLGHAHGHRDANALDEGGVVFRFVSNLSRTRWTALTSRPELAGWFVMPLDNGVYPCLRQVQSTLEKLAHDAGHDPLTGLARRDIFEHALVSEMERARRTKTSVSLALLDIDDFKRINDTCGHVYGDAVLRAFSVILKDGTRGSDICARYGGEEFALIMPATPMVKAVHLVERLMAATRDMKLDCIGLLPVDQITCSVGLACYKGLGELDSMDFIEMADKALYRAKGQGKNRIEKAPFRDIAPPLSRQTLVDPSEKTFLVTPQADD